MQAHWSREDLPDVIDAMPREFDPAGVKYKVVDVAIDAVVEHLNANHPKSDDVRRVAAQRDTQKTKARRARRARDKWQAACETATANATMWMDEAVEQRQRADDLERSLADIRSTLEASNDAMVEAITEERDALDDRLAKVDVELSEALARATLAEQERENWRITAINRATPADEPDPVEDKARELYEAARPATTVTWGDFVAEAKEPYRNMARHVLGAEA